MSALGIESAIQVCALTGDRTYNVWFMGWLAKQLSPLARAEERL